MSGIRFPPYFCLVEFYKPLKTMKTKLILTAMAAIVSSGAGAQTQPAPAKKVLVAYYSHSGNTREMARQIADVSGGELFEIVPVTPYPSDYQTVVDQAKREINAGTRPALKTRVEDMSQYDVVFVGSPCWWATVAPPVATFLTSYDFAGKTVVPFMTHEGSRMGRTEADIRKLCPKSQVPDGLPVRGGAVGSLKETVRRWVEGLGFGK